MASHRDPSGRPISRHRARRFVTLARYRQARDWKRLTAASPASQHHALATDGLKTRIAGTIDFVPVTSSAPRRCPNGSRDGSEKPSREAGIGARGDFPGPLFLAVAPIGWKWPHAKSSARRPVPMARSATRA